MHENGRAVDVSRDSGAKAVNTSAAPARSGLVLISLILVAAVANLNLSVANVALPDHRRGVRLVRRRR